MKASTVPAIVSVLADYTNKKVQISIAGQEAYCLVFGSQIKFSPAHPQSAHRHLIIYSAGEMSLELASDLS